MKLHKTLMLVVVVGLLSFTHARAEQDFLVDAAWLESHIDDPKLRILEVRYHPHRYFTVGHIPGAVQVQRFKDLGDNFGNPVMRFPSLEDFQTTLREWGINNDSWIVIYDDSRTALASRLYYLLDLYGYDMSRVKVLQGGTIEWTVFNELSRDDAEPEKGNVTLKPANKQLFVEWTDVYENVVSRRESEIVLLDARPQDMYTGEVVRHSPRGGHIPGAINIVSLDGTEGQTHKWRSPDRLKSLYSPIPKDKTVYVYCHDGFRMSLAYMQLKSLGYSDVRLYNGGWSHWGSTLALPVVESVRPYDAEFDL